MCPLARSSVLSPAAVPTQSAAPSVLVERENERVAQAGAVARNRREMGEGLRVPVEPVQAAPGRPDPERSSRSSQSAQTPRRPEAAGDRVVRDECRERSSNAVHQIEAVSVGADPEVAFAVLQKRSRPDYHSAIGSFGSFRKCVKVPVVRSNLSSADAYMPSQSVPLPVLINGLDPVVDDAARIVGLCV